MFGRMKKVNANELEVDHYIVAYITNAEEPIRPIPHKAFVTFLFSSL